MSYSNPMHHEDGAVNEAVRPSRPVVWPFPPAPLSYPSLAPDARPAPREPLPADLPDAPF
jgi:hypothetical protein